MNMLIDPETHDAPGSVPGQKLGLGGTGRTIAMNTSRPTLKMTLRSLLLALMGLAGLAGLGEAAIAQTTLPAAKKPFPELNLPERARGDDAVQALGGKLPEVAAWYGMSTQEFARMLRQDRTAWLDRKGKLLFIDGFDAPPEAIGEVASTANISTSVPAPLAQTFQMHSRPGAKRVIYLDFKGGTYTGTAWNSGWSISAINAPAFSLDTDATTFSSTELQRIQAIWQRVAEDYAPFDVDVTTEAPSTEAMTRSSTSDDTFGTRVMISTDWTALTAKPCGCGGIAYVSAYDDTSEFYKPAWVFYNRLGAGNEKYVAEAISHEAGHNLGLSHDGTSSVGYYEGHGSGATGWAPIMGVGYYRELTQWSKGEYLDANQTQDDLAVMQQRGAPPMADDHGDTMATATRMDAVLENGLLKLSGSGLISTRTDVDLFRFAMGAGNLVLNLTPGTRSPNLDIAAGLYDADGVLLAASNPVDALNASFNLGGLPAGTYYLRVDGTGKGDPSTGYSDYGSLGEYFITGTVPATDATNMPPVAVASATTVSGDAPLQVAFSSAGSNDPDGGALSYDWDFGDGSPHSSSANPGHTYDAGNYTATLTVTDASGSSDHAAVNISANQPVALPSLHVSSIALTASTSRKGINAAATVTVQDANGKPAAGAVVTGGWSGAVSGNVTGTTTSKGTVKFNSAYSKTGGTFTFTVTNVSLNGFVYDEGQNTETSDSVTR